MVTSLSRKRSDANDKRLAILVDDGIVVPCGQVAKLVEFIFTSSIRKAIA
jgi:hypothetical protein